jgi:ABC-type transport system involved in multi-copper enzyme maturation permease subunit
MKFLAMLRDSLRETLDVKLFYVMIGLSLLVSLLVASISYKPVPMQRQVTFITDFVNLSIQQQLRSKPETRDMNIRMEVQDFQQTNNTPEPWLGNYNFLYVITLSQGDSKEPVVLDQHTKEQREAVRAELKRALSAEKLERDFFKGLFVEVKVKELPSNDPDVMRFQVTTDKGTTVKSRHEWFHEPSLFFGLVPIPVPLFSLSQLVDFIGDNIVGTWGAAFTMLLSTILTASFIPSMLSKGTVDLLLVKPIHRVTLFVYKFLGGLLFMFLNTVIIMAGIWLGIGIQSGLWINSFLICILVYTFQFAIFYAVSALIAVLTRSAIVSILAAMMTWGVLVLVGWSHWFFIEKGRAEKPESTRHHWAYVGFDIAKTVLPRYKDLDWLTSKMIQAELIHHSSTPTSAGDSEAQQARAKVTQEIYEDQLKKLDEKYGAYHWTDSLLVSSLFIVIMLGLACWRFATKDY